MALFRWIAEKLLGPAKRDVSRLENDDLDLVDESVDLSGGPLKPGHHRKALRDRRLLPKRKASGFSPFKRKRYFSQEEAYRLFSRTQRTNNRRLRDLLPDFDQLNRLGLPRWETESDLASALGLTLPQLHHFAIHRYRDRVSHYVTFRVAKRSGGERLIMAPKKKLKEIQRKVLRKVLDQLPTPSHAHGFVKGRSVRSGADKHAGKKVVVKLDLADFFGTVTFPRVRGFFIGLGYGYPVATSLAVLTTACERQPVKVEDVLYQVPVGERHCIQGAPTSPALCNQIARKMDNRLNGLAQKIGFEYTRYADDLTFSGDDASKVKHLLSLARKIIEDEGFKIRPDKTRIMRAGGRQQVTGVTVNKVVGLSRKERRKLRALLHRLQNEAKPDPGELARARGKLAYLAMLNLDQAQALRERYPLFGN